MEQTLSNILGKARDYKMCQCNKINWYENAECVECGFRFGKRVKFNEKAVIKLIEADYDFYRKNGYAESSIDDILVDV